MTQIDQNESLAREVDEELAKERLAAMGRRYGPLVGGVIATILIAASAYVWWQNDQQNRRISETAQLLNLSANVTRGADEETVAGLAGLRGSASDGISTLARLEEARAMLQLNDPESATALLDGLAQRPETPEPFADLALLLLAQRSLDGPDPLGLAARLEALDQPGSVWQLAAAELRAQLLFRGGEAPAAIARLEQALDNPDLEASQQDRLSLLLDRYRTEAND